MSTTSHGSPSDGGEPEWPWRDGGSASRGGTRFFWRDGDADDARLQAAIAQAAEGSRDAMSYIYCRYSEAVYAYVNKIVRDDHEAEDVTQAVFTKLITHIERYEPRGVPFAAWLLRVARNAALDRLRQRRPVVVEDLRVSDSSTTEPAGDFQAGVRDALDELSADQQRVVLLRHVAGLTPGEIGARIGRSEASVHGLHHRGRRALRRALAARGIQPAVRARQADGARFA